MKERTKLSASREGIIDILKEVRPEFEFREEVNFVKSGMLDSLDVINLVVALDKEFGISIDGMDIVPDNFGSVNSILALLKKNGINDGSQIL
jgi:acyl carrier protein